MGESTRGDEFDRLHDEFSELELWDKELTPELLGSIDSAINGYGDDYDGDEGEQLYTFTIEE